MLLLLLSRGFDNLLELDDKGDVSTRDNGPNNCSACLYTVPPRRLSCHLMLSVVVRFPSLQVKFNCIFLAAETLLTPTSRRS
ncbi:hypothetical protein GQ457_14G015750 [Hibiscus cannabinus]